MCERCDYFSNHSIESASRRNFLKFAGAAAAGLAWQRICAKGAAQARQCRVA